MHVKLGNYDRFEKNGHASHKLSKCSQVKGGFLLRELLPEGLSLLEFVFAEQEKIMRRIRIYEA